MKCGICYNEFERDVRDISVPRSHHISYLGDSGIQDFECDVCPDCYKVAIEIPMVKCPVDQNPFKYLRSAVLKARGLHSDKLELHAGELKDMEVESNFIDGYLLFTIDTEDGAAMISIQGEDVDKLHKFLTRHIDMTTQDSDDEEQKP